MICKIPSRALGLAPHHQQMLVAISPEIAAERGYQSFSDVEVLKQAHPSLKKNQEKPGLALTGYRLGVPHTIIVRPDKPRMSAGKLVKYEHPAGVGLYLDVLPRFAAALADPRVPLWLVEGVKKADALASLGQNALPASLNGVWGWGQNGELLPDFDQVALDGRLVVIAFDSDVDTNPHVAMAREQGAQRLAARGARIAYTNLPPASGGEKQGLDDAIAAGWSFDDIAATMALWTPPAPKTSPERPRGPVGRDDVVGAYNATQSRDDVVADLCAMGGRATGREDVICPCGKGKRHTLRVVNGRVGKVKLFSRAPQCAIGNIKGTDAFDLFKYRHGMNDQDAVQRLAGELGMTVHTPAPAHDTQVDQAQKQLIAWDSTDNMPNTVRRILREFFKQSNGIETKARVPDIARKIGCTERTVYNAIKLLEGHYFTTETQISLDGNTFKGGRDGAPRRIFIKPPILLKMGVCGSVMLNRKGETDDGDTLTVKSVGDTKEKVAQNGITKPNLKGEISDVPESMVGNTEQSNKKTVACGVLMRREKGEVADVPGMGGKGEIARKPQSIPDGSVMRDMGASFHPHWSTSGEEEESSPSCDETFFTPTGPDGVESMHTDPDDPDSPDYWPPIPAKDPMHSYRALMEYCDRLDRIEREHPGICGAEYLRYVRSLLPRPDQTVLSPGHSAETLDGAVSDEEARRAEIRAWLRRSAAEPLPPLPTRPTERL